MKQLTNLLTVVITITAIVLLSSCTGNSNKSNDENTVLTNIKKEKVKQDVGEFVYPLPTAFEVTNMLNRIGASYILSLSNPASEAEKYFTEKSRALNLGIYSADLSYASTYNQKQTVIDYMNASNKLIEELGFADVISESTLAEIEAVENDKEKMIELITNTFYKSYEYMNKTGRGSVSVLVLAGSWVEGLYIATHISEDTYNNVEMVSLVMNQKEPLNILMELVKVNNSNTDVVEIGKMLEKLQSIFSELEEGSISQSQMEAITNEVASVRSAIVK